MKNLRCSTNISLYLGNDTLCVRSYNRRRIGTHVRYNLLKERVEKFQKQYQNYQNTVCQIVNNFKP